MQSMLFLNYAPRERKNSKEDRGFEERAFLFLTSRMKRSFFTKKSCIIYQSHRASVSYTSTNYSTFNHLFFFALAEIFICLCCINGSGFEIVYLQWLLKPSEICLFSSCLLVQLQYFSCTVNDISLYICPSLSLWKLEIFFDCKHLLSVGQTG